MLKRRAVGFVVGLGLVLTVALVVTAKSPTPPKQCIGDQSGCGITADTISLEGWIETPYVFGKGAVLAGPNDESSLDGSGLDTGYVNVTNVFATNVQTSYLTATVSKSFRIDHPLDPANRYLNHWSIESDDLKNIYDGVVALDARGAATVTLPAWFENLNADFRYQLTAMGAPGGNLYVAEEVSKGAFKIAGGKPNLKVSWQVTGVRHDAAAQRGKQPLEEEKTGNDKGKYLDPLAFGKPESERVGLNIPPKPARPVHKPTSKLISCLTKGTQRVIAMSMPIGASSFVLFGSIVAFRRSRRSR